VSGQKIGLLVIWVLSGYCVLAGGESLLYALGRLVFWLMLVVHAIEFVVMRRVFERSGGSMFHHFVQSLIYGLFHWSPLREKLREADGTASE
jgi:uncharacterized protein YhhL (DUF1145 family)